MNRSFAQFLRSRHAGWRSMSRCLLPVTCACVVAGCATLPPPTSELADAQQAVTRANDADADQYAADAIAQARAELAQAQAAMSKGRDSDARAAATAATTDAQYAYAASDAAKARADYAQQRSELLDLGQRVQLQADIPEQSPLDVLPAAPVAAPAPGKTVDPAAAPAARLQALDADPQLNGYAAYERLRAHQALDALAAARGRDREALARLAERRVATAELAARTQATRQATDQLQRQRSQWLVEASRQEAERARQEAERLRVQAQVQAEEAQRLQEQADAEAAARQQAEDVINTVGADEAAKLKAARDKEAALARQEAALMADGPKPAAKTPAKHGNSGKAASTKPPAKKKKGK
jgi:hypothetical protein